MQRLMFSKYSYLDNFWIVFIEFISAAKNDLSDEDRDSPALPRRPPMGANAFANLWKRSRTGGASSGDEEPGCFQRRQPGKYYTTEEYKIETTVSQHILHLILTTTNIHKIVLQIPHT